MIGSDGELETIKRVCCEAALDNPQDHYDPIIAFGFPLGLDQMGSRRQKKEFAANTPYSYSKTAIRLLVEMKLFRSL